MRTKGHCVSAIYPIFSTLTISKTTLEKLQSEDFLEERAL